MVRSARFLLAAACLFVSAAAAHAAGVRSANFVVEAPTREMAQTAAQCAEYYRRERALTWLGKEMPQWPEPCPLKVTVTQSGAGGATSFGYDRGRVLGQDMHVEGTAEKLCSCVIPHEVTHTVFAYYFGAPVPRWADEGAAVMSEDDAERKRHDQLCRDILNGVNGRQAIPLRRLFALKEYPSDVMALYAEGYCVTNWLVSVGGRPRYLAFVRGGMGGDWDAAARAAYGYADVAELEGAWLAHMKQTKGAPLVFEGRAAASQPAAASPPAPAAGSADARVLAALDRIEALVTSNKADTLRLQQDVAGLKARLDRLEGKPPAPAWNEPPLRVTPAAPVTPYVPGGAQIFQDCPGGKCPLPGRQ